MPRRTPFDLKLSDALILGFEPIAVCGNVACRYAHKVDLNLIARHVGIDHPLLPRRGEQHYSERLACAECGHRGAYIWLGEPTKAVPDREELTYKVERWHDNDTHVVEIMARARNLLVARSAYAEAVRVYPDASITLRQGVHVIEESPALTRRAAAKGTVVELRPVGPDLTRYGGKRRRRFGRR